MDRCHLLISGIYRSEENDILNCEVKELLCELAQNPPDWLGRLFAKHPTNLTAVRDKIVNIILHAILKLRPIKYCIGRVDVEKAPTNSQKPINDVVRILERRQFYTVMVKTLKMYRVMPVPVIDDVHRVLERVREVRQWNFSDVLLNVGLVEYVLKAMIRDEKGDDSLRSFIAFANIAYRRPDQEASPTHELRDIIDNSIVTEAAV